jgi:HD-GYP domain-containing protein (c-di-GMP phosphodiesterase class II)
MKLSIHALNPQAAASDLGVLSANLHSLFDSAPWMLGLVEIVAGDVLFVAGNAATARFFGQSPGTLRQRLMSELGAPNAAIEQWLAHGHEARRTGQPARFECNCGDAAHPRWLSVTVHLASTDSRRSPQLGYLAEEITERKERQHQLEALTSMRTALRAAPTRAEMIPILLDQLLALLDAEGAAFVTRRSSSRECVVELARGAWAGLSQQSFALNDEAEGGGLIPDELYLHNHVHTDPRFTGPMPLEGLHSLAAVPLNIQGQTLGALWLGRAVGFTPGDAHLLAAMADMAANAIHRSTLHEQTERRLRRLQALRTIDVAIAASHDVRAVMATLLDQVIGQLGVHAANLLLLNRHTQTLDSVAARGFRSEAFSRSRRQVGEGCAGRVALQHRLICISDLAQFTCAGGEAQGLAAEGFVAYCGVPLLIKGQLKGVLEVFHRARLDPDLEWLDFLETLAGQAAIAVDNAALLDDLLHSNTQLTLAYDATIEGWSRALDLRDKETEGHTERVTELTLRLAREMGIRGEALVHFYRGALLHDIGKVGVPDSILLKAGPLTEAEWAVMRQHPTYAYEMLSPIAYLRPALDIPYCHHEKWDGAGYPRGLKGEDIPLAARIFAVADVWDALCSNRPYRAGWPRERVRAYIRAEAGRHFDPDVVEVFLRLIGD